MTPRAPRNPWRFQGHAASAWRTPVNAASPSHTSAQSCVTSWLSENTRAAVDSVISAHGSSGFAEVNPLQRNRRATSGRAPARARTSRVGNELYSGALLGEPTEAVRSFHDRGRLAVRGNDIDHLMATREDTIDGIELGSCPAARTRAFLYEEPTTDTYGKALRASRTESIKRWAVPEHKSRSR